MKVLGGAASHHRPGLSAVNRFRYVHGPILGRNLAAQVRGETPHYVGIPGLGVGIVGHGFEKIAGKLAASRKVGDSADSTTVRGGLRQWSLSPRHQGSRQQ